MIVAHFAPLPILVIFKSSSGHKCVPGRPIGLTQARVSSVALGCRSKFTGQGYEGDFLTIDRTVGYTFRLPACAAP